MIRGLRNIIDGSYCNVLLILFLLAVWQCIKCHYGHLFTFNFARYNGVFKYLLFHLKAWVIPYPWSLEDKHKRSLQPGLSTSNCFYRSRRSSHQSWFHSSGLQILGWGERERGAVYSLSTPVSPFSVLSFVNNKSILIKLLCKTEIILFLWLTVNASKSCLAPHLSLVNYPPLSLKKDHI